MFDLTKYSFAMKNALPDVRANANYVTMEDNDHNGAIKALLELTEKNKGSIIMRKIVLGVVVCFLICCGIGVAAWVGIGGDTWSGVTFTI